MIAQAKEAWKKQQQSSNDGGGQYSPELALARLTDLDSTVVSDPEDPRFDLEKLVAKWEAES